MVQRDYGVQPHLYVDYHLGVAEAIGYACSRQVIAMPPAHTMHTFA
jgi:hypothetical protein